MEQRYFICEHCGNIVEMVKDQGVPIICCGQKMTELVPGSSDAATEKHVPVIEVDNSQNTVTVTVGEVEHPMLEAHFIEWISLQTKAGSQKKYLNPGQAPKAVFTFCEGDEVEAAYAYCNLHGLWKATL